MEEMLKLLVGNSTERSIPSWSMSRRRVARSLLSMPPSRPPMLVSIPSDGRRSPRRWAYGGARWVRRSLSRSTIWPSASITSGISHLHFAQAREPVPLFPPAAAWLFAVGEGAAAAGGSRRAVHGLVGHQLHLFR